MLTFRGIKGLRWYTPHCCWQLFGELHISSENHIKCLNYVKLDNSTSYGSFILKCTVNTEAIVVRNRQRYCHSAVVAQSSPKNREHPRFYVPMSPILRPHVPDLTSHVPDLTAHVPDLMSPHPWSHVSASLIARPHIPNLRSLHVPYLTSPCVPASHVPKRASPSTFSHSSRFRKSWIPLKKCHFLN